MSARWTERAPGDTAAGRDLPASERLAQNETWSVQTRAGRSPSPGRRYDVAAGDTQARPPSRCWRLGADHRPGLSLQLLRPDATINGADTFQGSVGRRRPMPSSLDAAGGTTGRRRRRRRPSRRRRVAQMPGGDDFLPMAVGRRVRNTAMSGTSVAAGWRRTRWPLGYIAPGLDWVTPRLALRRSLWRWFRSMAAGLDARERRLRLRRPPVYAPALLLHRLGVGIGIGAALASGSIGWCPLGREAYYPGTTRRAVICARSIGMTSPTSR